MNYYIKKNELYHYGVKGMKWGVRKEPERVGGLTQKEYNKYYTKGRLNAKGKKVRSRSKLYKSVGEGNIKRQVAQTAVAATFNHYLLGQHVVRGMRDLGNYHINKMKFSGASFNKRKAVAGAYIAAMGAYTMAEYSNAIATGYVSGRYKLDSKYRNKINTRANLQTYESKQRQTTKRK